jgi:hypothetical protein
MLLIMAVDSLPTRALAMIVAGSMMGTQEDVDIMALVAMVDVAKIVARGVKEAQLKSTIAPWGTKTVALPGLLADVVEEAMVMDMDHGADFGVEDPRKVAEGEEVGMDVAAVVAVARKVGSMQGPRPRLLS